MLSAPAACNHAHVVPVIRKLFAAIETNDIGTGLSGSIGPPLCLPAGKRKTYALMPAAEQSVKKLHVFLQNLIPLLT